jgi:site-specific recombinase XerD
MIVNSAANPSSGSIFDYADKQTELYEKNGQLNYAKHYKSVFTKLKNYTKSKKYSDLSFDEVDVTFLREYEAYLSSIGNNKNTIAKNFRVIRATFYNAARESLIRSDNNPFHIFKIKNGRTYNKALSLEELERLITVDLPIGSKEWHVRNYFLFSFYCAGIRISDLIQLKWSNIENKGHEYRLLYTMSKNGKLQNIKLSDKAKRIVMLYKNETTKPDNFLFPILKNNVDYKDGKHLLNQISSKNAMINKYLKSLASKAKISTNISFHVARHTFSDLARQKGYDIYKIKELLKHSNIKETEGYLATLDQESADAVLDNL